MNFTLATTLLLASLLVAGCAVKTERIDMQKDEAGEVMGLDYRDFNEAAGRAVQSMLKSGALDRPGGDRYVIAISTITNDTMQHIDTDQLIKKIRVDLLRSKRAVITTSIGSEGNVDEMSKKVRELDEDEDYNPRTMPKKGQLIAPDMSLSGKIIQRNITMDDGKQQVEYYFQLTLTEISSGLAWWEDETIIGKRGSGKSVAW
jgi:uncharacterized protein (TIGR02722 family)